MRIAIADLPEGAEVAVEGKRATITHGGLIVTVATDGENLILYPDRSYKQEALAVALGLKS